MFDSKGELLFGMNEPKFLEFSVMDGSDFFIMLIEKTFCSFLICDLEAAIECIVEECGGLSILFVGEEPV